MIISPKNKCTACSACIHICEKKAISMEKDIYGERYPVINEVLCKKCTRCLQVCPNNKGPEGMEPLKTLAAWRTNKEKRRISASGGIAL